MSLGANLLSIFVPSYFLTVTYISKFYYNAANLKKYVEKCK